MGSPNEPPRHVDMKKWSSSWDRIRANQAKQRAEAAAAELRDADARPVPDHLPPLPPGTRYGGVLDEYENRSCVRGHVFVAEEDNTWSTLCNWAGTKGCPSLREGVPDPLWHVAIPIEQQP